jgi:2-phospho-L-lactate guanylyltransferase
VRALHAVGGAAMSPTLRDDLAHRLGQRRGACALIAIKERVRCKTRLSESLSAVARVRLVRSMLAAVLSAAAGAELLRQIIVVSPERDSVPAHIPVLADTGECLNTALTQARRLLLEFGCRELVVLPADLPHVGAADIDALVRAARRGGFAIAPDAAGVGTNALCLVSTQPFRFQFGAGSLRAHLEEAQRIAVDPQVLRLPGLAFDVDSQADLNQLEAQQWLARRA